jgi:competence protein ComEA
MYFLKKILFILICILSFSVANAEPVNINQADAKSIASALNGIGIKKAEAITLYRDQNGPFKAVDDLAKVKGIGSKIIEKNRSDILLEK